MPDSTGQTLTKSSTISIGVAIAAVVVIAPAIWWQSADIATMKADLRMLPTIQKDVREMKQMLATNNGGDIRREAEIRSNSRRIEAIELILRKR